MRRIFRIPQYGRHVEPGKGRSSQLFEVGRSLASLRPAPGLEALSALGSPGGAEHYCLSTPFASDWRDCREAGAIEMVEIVLAGLRSFQGTGDAFVAQTFMTELAGERLAIQFCHGEPGSMRPA